MIIRLRAHLSIPLCISVAPEDTKGSIPVDLASTKEDATCFEYISIAKSSCQCCAQCANHALHAMQMDSSAILYNPSAR